VASTWITRSSVHGHNRLRSPAEPECNAEPRTRNRARPSGTERKEQRGRPKSACGVSGPAASVNPRHDRRRSKTPESRNDEAWTPNAHGEQHAPRAVDHANGHPRPQPRRHRTAVPHRSYHIRASLRSERPPQLSTARRPPRMFVSLQPREEIHARLPYKHLETHQCARPSGILANVGFGPHSRPPPHPRLPHTRTRTRRRGASVSKFRDWRSETSVRRACPMPTKPAEPDTAGRHVGAAVSRGSSRSTRLLNRLAVSRCWGTTVKRPVRPAPAPDSTCRRGRGKAEVYPSINAWREVVAEHTVQKSRGSTANNSGVV